MHKVLNIVLISHLLFLYSPNDVRAGAGKVSVVEESGFRVGEVDLTVALDWDPDAPGGLADWENIENYIRNASTVLCDATDGNFRLGRVRFVRSASSAYQKDVVLKQGELMERSGTTGYIGDRGSRIKQKWADGSATLAHELVHYVFHIGDSYGEENYFGGPCGFGPGDEGGSNSLMGPSSDSKCTYFDGIDWVSTQLTCNSAFFCEQEALDPYNADWGITNPVWGRGQDDNIRCTNLDGSELSTKVNFDTVNGVGILFDRRAEEFGNTGPWGDPGDPTSYKQQLDRFTKQAIGCCEGDDDMCAAWGYPQETVKDYQNRCLYDCPPPIPSNSIDVTIVWSFPPYIAPTESDWYPAGDEMTYQEAYNNALTFPRGANLKGVGSVIIQDELGIADYSHDVNQLSRYCNLNADSLHTVHYFLLFRGMNSDDLPIFTLIFAMPTSEFDDNDQSCETCNSANEEEPDTYHRYCPYNDGCMLKIVDILEFEGVEGDSGAEIVERFEGIAVGGFRENECFEKKEEKDAVPGDEDYFERTPPPLLLDINIAGNEGLHDALVVKSDDEIRGNCGWEWGRYECAEAWRPNSTADLLSGEWASSMQTLWHAEWDWHTVFRKHKKGFTRGGEEIDFVTYTGDFGVPEQNDNECFYYRGKEADLDDPNNPIPKGAYDVEFKRYDKKGSNVVMLMDRSGSMDNVDDDSGESRMSMAKAAARSFVKNVYGQLEIDSTDEVNLGLVSFNTDENCNGTDTILTGANSDCDLHDLRTTHDVWPEAINSIGPPKGGTALNDALAETAIFYLAFDTNAQRRQDGLERLIYLITDGKENKSLGYSTQRTMEKLDEYDVIVHAVGIGEADIEYLNKVTGISGGAISYSKKADGTANAMLDAYSSGEHRSLIKVDGGESAVFQSILSKVGTVWEDVYNPEFVVPAETSSLILLFTNHGYAATEDNPRESFPEEVKWDIGVNLLSPDGKIYSNELSADLNKITNYSYEIENRLLAFHIPNPAAGTWHLQTWSGIADVRSYMTISAHHPNAKLYANASPQTLKDEGEVVVSPALNYGTIALDTNHADCAGTVFGPGDFAQTIQFENSRYRVAKGEPPQARITNFNGRGIYRVEIECDVPEDIPAIFGQNEYLELSAIKQTATTYFFYDTTEMPFCDFWDCDGDGVHNDDEAIGDSDDDGWPDYFDTDSDNDEIGDLDDNCPTIENYVQLDVDGDGIGDACDDSNSGGYCIMGHQSVWVGDNADVDTGVSSNQYVEVGAYARVGGDVLSAGDVFLRESCTVEGNVISTGHIDTQNNINVIGQSEEEISFPITGIPIHSVSYGDQNVEISIDTLCSQTLAPGDYGTVIVRPGCALTLSPGVYNMFGLSLNADADFNAELVIEGIVDLNIENDFQIGDRSIIWGITEPNDFSIYTNQTTQVRIGVDSVAIGNIMAPSAEVVVSPDALFDGCIYADHVRIEANALITGDHFPPLDCGNGVLDGNEECDDGNGNNSDDCLTNCKLATCNDSFQHSTRETDVDCGGECQACEIGKQCVENIDCASFHCENSICVDDDATVTATLNIDSEWNEGYCVTAILTNQQTELVNDWTVIISSPDSDLSDSWNGIFSSENGVYTVSPESYNNTIYPFSPTSI